MRPGSEAGQAFGGAAARKSNTVRGGPFRIHHGDTELTTEGGRDRPQFTETVSLVAALSLAASGALAHGDVAPPAMDITGLPELDDEWLIESPYRAEKAGEAVWRRAIEIGASGYNSNCARCHRLQAISGGLAPDMRFLEAEEYGDE